MTQSAYKTAHSTVSALLKVQNDILRTVDHGGVVVLVLLDLSAAFDTIDPQYPARPHVASGWNKWCCARMV